MDQTDIWMLGVGAFGVVFYLFSLYFARSSSAKSGNRNHTESDVTDKD